MSLWNYILENEILCFLAGRSRRIFVHSVAAGGQAMSDTLNGLQRLAETTAEKNVIVWLNGFFGEVSQDGKPFEQFRVAEEQAHKLLGTVVIRERNPNTYGDDMRLMLAKRLTFQESSGTASFASYRNSVFRSSSASCSSSWIGSRWSEVMASAKPIAVDVQRLIEEVAARHRLVLKSDDAALAVVTMNRLVLEESFEAIHSRILVDLALFEAAARKIQTRAVNVLVAQVRESAAGIRKALESDIQQAGLEASGFVRPIEAAYQRHMSAKNVKIATLAAMLLLFCGSARPPPTQVFE